MALFCEVAGRSESFGKGSWTICVASCKLLIFQTCRSQSCKIHESFPMLKLRHQQRRHRFRLRVCLCDLVKFGFQNCHCFYTLVIWYSVCFVKLQAEAKALATPPAAASSLVSKPVEAKAARFMNRFLC